MKTFFKILIGLGGLVILLFTQCRKKNQTPNITNWLEKEYPNRFEVLDTYTDDIIRNLSFSIKHSIVAEKSNPMVQAKLHWNANFEDLKLTKGIVDSAFINAKSDYEDAQTLYKILHNHVLKDVSVSIKSGIAMVLIFAEPTPEHRQMSLNILEKCFAQWQKSAEYDINVSYLEPSEKNKAFKEIVPLLYWSQSYSEFQRNMLYWTFCPLPERFSAKKLAHNWRLNTGSNRFMVRVESARKEAQTWASEHLKRPFTILDTVEFDQSYKNINLVNLKFPLAYKGEIGKTIEIDGYISMDYEVERNTFGRIKLMKE